jgi:2-haloacid dehalogenase
MGERWATFDCYGTLIDWETGIGEALAGVWPSADWDRLVVGYHRIEPEVQREYPTSPYRDVMSRALARLAEEEGLELREGDRGVLGESLPSWPPFPEAAAALTELRRRGWRLAVLSNTDPDLLATSLSRIGVPVDLRITAAEAGSYKPAHGHWERFFEGSGADRDRHVHVGASLFHDIAPAGAELGLRTAWINRLHEVTNLRRDAELTDLTNLPDTLDRLVPAEG